MSAITTHVLDLSRGRPADGVPVTLEMQAGKDQWKEIAIGATNADGRVSSLLPTGDEPAAGVYRLSFDTGSYFRGKGVKSFYPGVAVVFEVANPAEHYHVPLLLSPYGYSTYRGS